MLDHERSRKFLRFAPLQGELGDRLRASNAALAGIDSVIWCEPSADGDGKTYVRSAAVLRVLRYLGGGWSVLAAIGSLVPRPVRDWLYDVVARHRKRIIKQSASCLAPTPEQRERFRG